MPRKKVTISASHLKYLKQQVVQLFGKPISTKPDCMNLSELVLTKTGTYLSESTLRRFFGLIPSTSQPSQQTLDTLARLVGSDNWHHFINGTNNPVNTVKHTISWEDIRHQAQNVTEISLNRLKGGLGLPYDVTTSRPFARELMHSFAESQKNALCMYAPSGAGKSTMLAHWVEERQANTEDIIWLVQGGALSHLLHQGFTLENWLYQSLGISSASDVLGQIQRNEVERMGILWLIIDDFSFQQITSEECVNFYRDLLPFIQENHKRPWLKVVLSVQTPFWYLVIKPLRQQLSQEHCWYIAAEASNSEEGNVPPLSIEEVKHIIDAYFAHHPAAPRQKNLLTLPFHVQELLRNPFLLQLYLTTDSISDDNELNELSLVELSVQKIMRVGPYAYEKLQVIQQMVSLEVQYDMANGILKSELTLEDKKATRAYEDLLKSGILEEDIEYKGLFNAAKIVRFANAKVFAFVVVSYILEKQSRKLDIALATELGQLFKQSEALPELLRWLLLIGFQEKNTKFLSQFFDLDFLFKGKTYNDALVFHLVTTLGVQLRHQQELRKELWPVYAQHPLGQSYYYELFVDIDYLVIHHYEALRIYLQHKHTTEARLFVNSLHFLKGFLEGNDLECKKAYRIVQSIKPDLSIHPTPLGRRFACILLHEHFYGRGISRGTIDQLFEVEKQLPKSGPLGQHLPTFHTLVSEALNWCEQYTVARDILNKAACNYTTDESFVGASFHQQLLVNWAKTQLRLKEVDTARLTFNKIKPYLFDVHSRQYNLIGYYLLKSLLLKNIGEAAEADTAYTNAKEIAHKLKYQNMIKNIFPLYLK